MKAKLLTDTLTSFLDDLAAYQTPNTTNLYLPCGAANCHAEQRRINLTLYLSHFLLAGCATLLIGEAPGYKGCRVTGVPFTSEYIIENNRRFREQFPQIVHQYRPNEEFGTGKKESSATCVWQTLEQVKSIPLPCCWNIFPLHPYDPEDTTKGIWSNRTPTHQEVKDSSAFTRRLIELLHPQQIIAIGNTSFRKLSQMVTIQVLNAG